MSIDTAATNSATSGGASPKAPEKLPAQPAAPELVAVRFPTPVNLHNMDMVEVVKVSERTPVFVQGGSVFILDRETLAEVPRHLAILRWRVPAGMGIAEAVAKITKGPK